MGIRMGAAPTGRPEALSTLLTAPGGYPGQCGTKLGQSHQLEALPALPSPVGAHAAANSKFAFLLPAASWARLPELAIGRFPGQSARAEAGGEGDGENRNCRDPGCGVRHLYPDGADSDGRSPPGRPAAASSSRPAAGNCGPELERLLYP